MGRFISRLGRRLARSSYSPQRSRSAQTPRRLRKNSHCKPQPSTAEAGIDFAILTARLKPRTFKTKSKSEFLRRLLGMEIEFYDFFGFLRGRRPFPFVDGIDGGGRQHRTATKHGSELQFSVGRHDGFQPDGSADLHFAGQLWIHRHHLAYNLPLRVGLVLRESERWRKYNHSQEHGQQRGYGTMSHGELPHATSLPCNPERVEGNRSNETNSLLA